MTSRRGRFVCNLYTSKYLVRFGPLFPLRYFCNWRSAGVDLFGRGEGCAVDIRRKTLTSMENVPLFWCSSVKVYSFAFSVGSGSTSESDLAFGSTPAKAIGAFFYMTSSLLKLIFGTIAPGSPATAHQITIARRGTPCKISKNIRNKSSLFFSSHVVMRIILGGMILQDNVGVRTEDTENMKFLHLRYNSCITQMSHYVKSVRKTLCLHDK